MLFTLAQTSLFFLWAILESFIITVSKYKLEKSQLEIRIAFPNFLTLRFSNPCKFSFAITLFVFLYNDSMFVCFHNKSDCFGFLLIRNNYKPSRIHFKFSTVKRAIWRRSKLFQN